MLFFGEGSNYGTSDSAESERSNPSTATGAITVFTSPSSGGRKADALSIIEGLTTGLTVVLVTPRLEVGLVGASGFGAAILGGRGTGVVLFKAGGYGGKAWTSRAEAAAEHLREAIVGKDSMELRPLDRVCPNLQKPACELVETKRSIQSRRLAGRK